MKSKSAMAFIGLVIIQVGIGLIYKLAAAGSSGYAFSQASALAMSEAFKLGMSSLFYYQSLQESNKLLPSLFSQFLSEVPPKVRNGMILLSVLYLVNNHVFFYLVTLADPGTINLVKSSSTFLTATILWTFVNRVPTKIQWFSIAFQSLGLITSQYDECKGSSSYSFFVYLLIFLNTAISAVCGSYNDYLTKASSASLHALNMWLYVFGFVLNTAFYFFLSIINPEQPGFFEGYNGWGFFVVVCNSVIGLAITAVYKYGDAIIKCLAQSTSTSVLIVLSFLFFGSSLRVLTAVGCMIIFLATYTYMTPMTAPEPKNILPLSSQEVKQEKE